MYVIEVIPLKKGLQLESLTYYSSFKYPAGTILTIPVRNSTAQALVMDSSEVSSAKTTLRAATFSLRKLPPQEKTATISENLLTTAQKLSARYPYRLGTILFSLLPPEIKTGKRPFPQIHAQPANDDTITIPEVLLASHKDRIASYQSIIRSTFAHGGSVLIVVPTIANIEPLRANIDHGIADRIVTMTSGSQKQLDIRYHAYEDCSKAKVIITTPSHAFLDRHDITTIIIDQSRSQHYNQRTQPYLDLREALLTYAKTTGKNIIYADTVVRSEEHAKVRDGFFQPHDDHPKRLNLPAKLHHIQRPKRENGREYQLITPEVTEAIDAVLSTRHNVFVYAPRRGLAPIVLCGDCGFIFRCEDSGAPYTLETKVKNGEEERWFVAKTSGKRIRAADVCPECGSWKLREQGIGIQKVYQHLTNMFPDNHVILFDSETAKTQKRAKLLMKKFYESKGAILVGTSMVFPLLDAPVHTSVVTSLEAVRATPTWRAQEELFGLLMNLRERSTDAVYVQSKEAADDTVKMSQKGLVEQFYTEELALRQILNYPPFATFIHLTWRGNERAGRNYGDQIKKIFAAYQPAVYPDPNNTGQKMQFYALIRVATTDWPNDDLMQKLRNLPPSVRIMINPDRII